MKNAQTREIKAAVIRKKGGPFQIETLTLEEPRPDEALVRIVATVMCHTDMMAVISSTDQILNDAKQPKHIQQRFTVGY